jgi:hypothetical protein
LFDFLFLSNSIIATRDYTTSCNLAEYSKKFKILTIQEKAKNVYHSKRLIPLTDRAIRIIDNFYLLKEEFKITSFVPCLVTVEGKEEILNEKNILKFFDSLDQELYKDTIYFLKSGIKNLCATKEEIDDIRKRDREVQGITQEDEFLAKESFEIACNNKPNLIYSKTPKFSAVSDLAYYKFDNYVIYNNEKVLFYGYKKENIQEFLKSQDIEESKYYYGGGDFGFVGIKDRVFSEDEIKNILEKFKKFDKKEEIYSYHTFMLPFTFENEFDKKENWKYKHFEIENQRDYNEYVYFYKHIQDAIYNKDTEEKSNISKYYEYEFEEGAYTIK